MGSSNANRFFPFFFFMCVFLWSCNAIIIWYLPEICEFFNKIVNIFLLRLTLPQPKCFSKSSFQQNYSRKCFYLFFSLFGLKIKAALLNTQPNKKANKCFGSIGVNLNKKGIDVKRKNGKIKKIIFTPHKAQSTNFHKK